MISQSLEELSETEKAIDEFDSSSDNYNDIIKSEEVDEEYEEYYLDNWD